MRKRLIFKVDIEYLELIHNDDSYEAHAAQLYVGDMDITSTCDGQGFTCIVCSDTCRCYIVHHNIKTTRWTRIGVRMSLQSAYSNILSVILNKHLTWHESNKKKL